MQKEEIALVEEIARRIAREEIVLALAVKLPKVIEEPEEKPAVVKKTKKYTGKKGW